MKRTNDTQVLIEGGGEGEARRLCNWQPNGVGINLSPGGIF